MRRVPLKDSIQIKIKIKTKIKIKFKNKKYNTGLVKKSRPKSLDLLGI